MTTSTCAYDSYVLIRLVRAYTTRTCLCLLKHTHKVVVQDLVCNGGHGISIGSVRHGQIDNVTFRRIQLTGSSSETVESGGVCRLINQIPASCSLLEVPVLLFVCVILQHAHAHAHVHLTRFARTHARNFPHKKGCRIKTYPNGTGYVQNVLYEDIEVHGVAFPLQILAQYCPKSQKPYPCPPGDTDIAVRDITFRRVRGTGKYTSVGNFSCSAIVPCTNITLDDVDLRGDGGSTEGTFGCNNCHGSSQNTTPASCFSSKK